MPDARDITKNMVKNKTIGMKTRNIIKTVGEWLKSFPTFLFLLLILSGAVKAENYIIPDFAFPQTVEKESSELLNESLSAGEDLIALRAALNLCISRNLLTDSEGISANLELLDTVGRQLKDNSYLAITELIEAQILSNAYSDNTSLYDSRKLPIDTPFPADPMEWSGEMFKARILELVSQATSGIGKIANKEIDEISLLITNYKLAQGVGMDLRQFIYFKGAELLERLTGPTTITVIPFYPTEVENSIEGQCKQKAEYLLGNIIDDLSRNNSLIKALAIKEMCNLLPDDGKESYLRSKILELNGTEGEGILLYDLWSSYGRDSHEFYSEIRNWVDKFPKGFGNGQLRYALAAMSEEKIEVQLPKVSLPYTTIKGEANLSNIKQGYLLVYKVGKYQATDYDELILKRFKPGKPLQIIPVGEDGTIPFSTSKNIELKGLEAGLYVVIPSKTRSLSSDWGKGSISAYYSTFRVSDIAILSSCDSNEKESGRIYVVKGANQEPVEGVTVSYFSGSSKTAVGKAKTNKEGFIAVPNGYYRIEALLGNSLARREAGFSYYPENNNVTTYATILTDLSIYKPGDTVRFAVVGWKQEKLKQQLLKNHKAEVVLRDVNYANVGAVELNLSQEGRGEGFIVIPKGRLAGEYRLIASFPEFPNSGNGVANILVQDYKLPAFQVIISQNQNESLGYLDFSGIATTYAGLPITEGIVSWKMEYRPWRWGMMGSNTEFHATTVTDSEGKFILQLSTENLKGTIFEKGRYSLTATVTSPSGETEMSQPLSFSLGNGYDIRPQIPDKVLVESDSVRFNVPVYDMAGLRVKTVLEYTITDLSDTTHVLKGNFESPELKVPSKVLSSGRYKVELQLPEGNEQTITEFTLWRSQENKVPYPTPLWVPKTQYEYKEGQQEIEISFGSYWPDWLLCVLSDGQKTIDYSWIPPGEGMIIYKVEFPEGDSTFFLTVAGMHEFEGEVSTIKIVPQISLSKMAVTTTSFRENIAAGAEEEWSFKFKIDEKGCPFVNVFAVMTDKALNALRDFRWSLNMWEPHQYSRYSLSVPRYGSSVSYRSFTAIKSYPSVIWTLPNWQTYNYPLVSENGWRFGGPVLYKSMATRNAITDSTAGMVLESAQDEASIETPMVEKEGDQKEEEGIELRPIEMPLAFFKTKLQTNEDGDLTLRFKVPNFNTTWQLQLAGYNEELQNASLLLDAVAAKPVMVKSNLPQFLRTSDLAEISATLYNNSDSVMSLGGKLEIFDAISGEILANKEFLPLNVAPSSNRVVNIGFKVPDNTNIIAVRSYAMGENHTDGEQGFIPVLPSSTPVTEAITFYAASQDESITIAIPKLKKDANVTLKYCDNPLWEVLLSLPGMASDNSTNTLSLSRSLYNILLSNHLINNNSEIYSGIQKIIESSDSSLTRSNLEKDSELKITDIEATPWLNNATKETSRIRSLGKYLDNEYVSTVIKLKKDALLRVQKSDGGFGWFSEMNSSPYITSEVISVAGNLKENGLLDAELDNMAKRAVNYYESWLEAKVKKDKKINVSEVLNYLYSRNKLDYPQSKFIRNIETECLDSLSYQWKYLSPGQKAKVATVMSGNDGFKETALEISESLKEFLDSRLSMSDESLILNLFLRIGEETKYVDKVLQKMLLQKETVSLSEETDPTGIINSIIKAIPSTFIERAAPKISIGDLEVELIESQNLTGVYTINLTKEMLKGKEIRIERQSGVPAWGGLISQYIAPIKDVKNEKVENLSIEKHLYVIDEKGRAKEVSTFKKGDKISVVLNVTCGKDMDYIVIKDWMPACLRPDNRISGMTNADGLFAYKEIQPSATSFFIEYVSAGKYVFRYDCHAERDGEYTSGISEIQCLYSPSQVAHSSGRVIKIM